MVAKMLALAMIVAAVGAAAIENPLAGDKSDSGIESPAAGSAEYGDAEEIHLVLEVDRLCGQHCHDQQGLDQQSPRHHRQQT